MKRLSFHPHLCVGCFACESACKGEHRLPSGVRWLRVHRTEESAGGDKMDLPYKITVCRQCETAPCIVSCPSGAIDRRPDGPVVLQEEKCSGCRECLGACPWGAIAFDEGGRRASKCNLCSDLIEPRCLAYCPTGALAADSQPDPATVITAE